MREKLDAVGFGFLIPLFFILVRTNFDLGAVLAAPAALGLVPVLIGAAYGVKLLPAVLLRTVCPWPETWAAGVLLAARLSLIIAASAITLGLGLITPSVNAAVMLVAVLTGTPSPILRNRSLLTGEAMPRRGHGAAGPVGRQAAAQSGGSGDLRQRGRPFVGRGPAGRLCRGRQ